MIQRPHNPHLSKEWNDSNLSLPPVFINPFELRKDSVDSYGWQDKEPQTHTIAAFNRHEVMAYYQPQPLDSYHPSPEKTFGSLPEGTRRHSVLGLEGMDRPAISQPRSRPSLSINVPPNQSRTVVPVTDVDEDHEKIGRIMSMAITSPMSLTTPAASEEPCAAIGRTMSMAVISPPSQETPAASEEAGAAIGRRMSMPFKSPISEDSGSSHTTGGRTMNSSMNATAAHMASAYTASTISHAPNQATSRTPERRTLRDVNAANGYPAIQQSINRQSTMVKHDSLSIRRAMRYGQDGQPMFNYVPAYPNPWDSFGRPAYQHTPSHSGSSGGSYDVNRYDYNRPIDVSYQQMHRSRQPFTPQAWPQQRRAYTGDGQSPAFSMRIPPPPNYSPEKHSRPRTTSSSGRSYSGMSVNEGRSHTRSASTPTFQQTIAPPMPALLDALSPVLRNSGNYQNFTYPSQRSSVTNQQFQQRSNAFGPVRSVHSSSDSLRFEEMNLRIQDVSRDDPGSRRASKLRKSLPRIA
jgi:hypothetical protein